MYNTVFTVPSIYQSGRSPFISPPCTPSLPFPGPNYYIYVPTPPDGLLTQTTLYSESYDRQTTTGRNETSLSHRNRERHPPK